MKYLQDSGNADNTIIIYISDNGMAFQGAKTNLYEPGAKLPCLITYPGIKNRGTVCDGKISWVDLTPTILDMTGVDTSKEKFQGHSFADLLEGKQPSSKWSKVYGSHTFHEITMYYPMRVVWDGDYKLIWNIAWPLEYPFASDLWVSSTWQSVYRNHSKLYGKRSVKNLLHRKEFELYNLKNDPNELINLAYDENYSSLVEKMKSDLKSWQLQTRDPWYIMWSHDATMQGAGEKL